MTVSRIYCVRAGLTVDCGCEVTVGNTSRGLAEGTGVPAAGTGRLHEASSRIHTNLRKKRRSMQAVLPLCCACEQPLLRPDHRAWNDQCRCGWNLLFCV